MLARLVRTQGRYGELLAEILTDFPERFADRTQVWLLSPEAKIAPREAQVERHWLHKGRIVLKFAGIDSINKAEGLSGWHVAVPREQRASLTDNAVYISDLIGCHVIDETAGAADLGPITEVRRGEGAMLDTLVVQSAEGELLIPFAKAYLSALDLDAHILRMRLPVGLTALNAPLTDEERALQRLSGKQA